SRPGAAGVEGADGIVQIAQHQKIIAGAVGGEDVGSQIEDDLTGGIVADGKIESARKPLPRIENLLDGWGIGIGGNKDWIIGANELIPWRSKQTHQRRQDGKAEWRIRVRIGGDDQLHGIAGNKWKWTG